MKYTNQCPYIKYRMETRGLEKEEEERGGETLERQEALVRCHFPSLVLLALSFLVTHCRELFGDIANTTETMAKRTIKESSGGGGGRKRNGCEDGCSDGTSWLMLACFLALCELSMLLF